MNCWRSVIRCSILFLLLGLFLPGPALALPPPLTGEAADRERLSNRLSALLSDPALKGAQLGVTVRDAESGAAWYGRNQDKRLLVASNVKLMTTAAALQRLGVAYQFKTGLYYRGPLLESAPRQVKGDLVVKASADPTLSGRFEPSRTAIFERWAAAIKKAGIGRVRGNLVIDDRVLDRQGVHPTWPKEQRTRWYCAETGGFSLNDNCIDLTVRPGAKVGQPATVSFEPATGFVTLVNKVRTVDKKEKAVIWIRRNPGTNRVVVGGAIRLGSIPYRGNATVHHPSVFAGAVLKRVLEQAGITIDGKVLLAKEPLNVSKEPFVLVAEHRTDLMRAITVANQRSQNFFAEQILKTLGHEASKKKKAIDKEEPKEPSKPEPGSFENGSATVAAFLSDTVGLKEGYALVDGSGLSRKNRFSATDVSQLLLFMARSEHAKRFRDSLAAPGEAGTLRNRLADPACKGRVRAKTGTLNGASALSGYATTADGRTFLFSIVINKYRCSTARVRQIQDAIVTLLVKQKRTP